jgi:lysophospholipase L1-like esterase
MSSLSSRKFFNEYHGHRLDHLQTVADHLITNCNKRRIVWLAGDSSMDSKYWFDDTMPAASGYERLLTPPVVKQDLSGHLNALFAASDATEIACVNTAVEESTLGQRSDALLPHDQFIADHVRANDVIMVSVGGNDIALRPSLGTVWNMLIMQMFNSVESISQGPSAWGMSHFVRLFGAQLEDFLARLCAKTKPAKIIVCMIYYPDEKPSGGWADRVLGYLSYYSNPRKLQAAIQQIFIHAVSKISVPGVKVVPFPLYSVMDGSDSSLYVAGVEPSAKGNEAIATAICHECVATD